MTLTRNSFAALKSSYEMHFTFLPRCRVPWKPGGINSDDDDDHEGYLNKFKSAMLNKLQLIIKKSLEEEPELKSRKKIVEVGRQY